jgi:hypothetical protein
VAPRTRVLAFGACGVLVVSGALSWVLIAGLTGEVIAIACLLVGLGGALLLVFYEVGLSEDRARARQERRRRRGPGASGR